MESSFLVKHNDILIPAAFALLSIIVKICAVARNDPAVFQEMRNHFFLTGVEFCILSLSIYVASDFLVLDFFGITLQESHTGNILFSAKLYTLTQIILLCGALYGFRSYHERSFLISRFGPGLGREIFRAILIIFSFSMGYLSLRLLVMLVNECILQ